MKDLVEERMFRDIGPKSYMEHLNFFHNNNKSTIKNIIIQNRILNKPLTTRYYDNSKNTTLVLDYELDRKIDTSPTYHKNHYTYPSNLNMCAQTQC